MRGGRVFASTFALVAIAAAVLVAAIAAAPAVDMPAAPAASPNPKTCDANPGGVVMCAKIAGPYTFMPHTVVFSGPRAERVFTGGYVWISERAAANSWKVRCDAKLGGRLVEGAGGLALIGGIRLRPIIRHSAASVTVAGTAYVTRITCGWRIPASARGKLLSLVWPELSPQCEDEFTCEPWGLHFDFGDGADAECSETTWRVRGHDAAIGPEVRDYHAC